MFWGFELGQLICHTDVRYPPLVLLNFWTNMRVIWHARNFDVNNILKHHQFHYNQVWMYLTVNILMSTYWLFKKVLLSLLNMARLLYTFDIFYVNSSNVSIVLLLFLVFFAVFRAFLKPQCILALDQQAQQVAVKQKFFLMHQI